MKCHGCHRDISKADSVKMICEYVQADQAVLAFGLGNAVEGTLDKATGRLIRAWHCTHYHMGRKREARGGDAVTGRMSGDIATAYEQSEGTTAETLMAQQKERRELARKLKSGTDSWDVKEAVMAQAHAPLGFVEVDGQKTFFGEYPHTHSYAIADFQVKFHLQFGHSHLYAGFDQEDMRLVHAEYHAREAQRAIVEARVGDPEMPERKWPASDPLEAEI